VFTGIVEELGVVESVEDQGDAVRLRVRGPQVVEDAWPGDSVAVDGCCLTVAERDEESFTADVMRETLDKTTLGTVSAGTSVNLERAATLTSRLGGHLVQGHVDGTARILARTPSQHWELVEVALPGPLARYVVPKGSVTVDGVSLTIVEVYDGDRPSFTVSLIPETLARTSLGRKQPGDSVNLEVDVIAKYVERLLGAGARPGDDGGDR
jgi:riboflavin synthase